MTITTDPAAAIDEITAKAMAHARGLARNAAAAGTVPAAAAAIADLEARNPGHVLAWPDGNGGSHVFLDAVDLGAPYAQATTWMAFHIANTTPNCDVYPHWIRSDLTRVDGIPIVPPLHVGNNWLELAATMVSLASNKRDPLVDTPAHKVVRVLTKIRSL
jgi:F420-dependent methylenetetrahydromethanopterin dehydrogenase